MSPQALACVKGTARHSSCVSLSSGQQNITQYIQPSSSMMHWPIRAPLPFASQKVTECHCALAFQKVTKCPCALALQTMPECLPFPFLHINIIYTYSKNNALNYIQHHCKVYDVQWMLKGNDMCQGHSKIFSCSFLCT